jgi:Family of unknown function (DUF5701)
VTRDRALKQAVRERAASTGEKYTQARRALADGDGAARDPDVAAAAVEFDRQVATLIARGYPRSAGLDAAEFAGLLEPLRPLAVSAFAERDPDVGRPGFVIIVAGALVPASVAITLVERRGKAGFLSMLTPEDLATFAPIEAATAPDGAAYVMSDVDTGSDSRNRTPDAALATILEHGRSPLTIGEGIALITHFPEAVATNGGFSLAGSRCGDRRVCALWISQGAPKLGWCWAGNPHTWLGTASCGGRAGASR